MAAAQQRGPDGGADGSTPSNKAKKRKQAKLKREQEQQQRREGGGGAVAVGAGATASAGGAAGSGTGTAGPRKVGEKAVSGHQFAACKRAVLALHALAKDPSPSSGGGGGTGDPIPTLKALTPALAAVADARLASTALWATAKVAARLERGNAVAAGDAANPAAVPSLVADVEAVSLLVAALAARAGAVAPAMDARGLSTSLWALATLAATQASGGGSDRVMSPAAATAAGRPMLRALATAGMGAACNPQDAANALWACARLRLAPNKQCAAALASALCAVKGTAGSGTAKPHEMSMALWGLASLYADGTLPTAPAAAAPLAALAARAASSAVSPSAPAAAGAAVSHSASLGAGTFSPQAVANAAWAAGKLIGEAGGGGGVAGASDGEGDRGGGTVSVGDKERADAALGASAAPTTIPVAAAAAAAAAVHAEPASAAMVEACRELVSSLAATATAAAPGTFTGQGMANVLWACAAVGVSPQLAAPLVLQALSVGSQGGGGQRVKLKNLRVCML
jgi:hypothetical protein